MFPDEELKGPMKYEVTNKFHCVINLSKKAKRDLAEGTVVRQIGKIGVFSIQLQKFHKVSLFEISQHFLLLNCNITVLVQNTDQHFVDHTSN